MDTHEPTALQRLIAHSEQLKAASRELVAQARAAIAEAKAIMGRCDTQALTLATTTPPPKRPMRGGD